MEGVFPLSLAVVTADRDCVVVVGADVVVDKRGVVIGARAGCENGVRWLSKELPDGEVERPAAARRASASG